MPLESGYYYIELDTLVFPTNPTRSTPFRAERLVARTATLTKTVTQLFIMDNTDKQATYEWLMLDKTTVDSLITLYEASYSYYTFVDEYNNSHQVVISNLEWERITKLDEDGFRVVMTLLKVG